MTGKLVIVPTPLGNLGDMTARALEALRSVDAVLAEDTRVTGKLLAALGVAGVRTERLDENLLADPARVRRVLERVLEGQTIAYCSDAGMPGVSDPGMRLVRAAREAGAPVEVLPGPTAVATAYVASGTPAPAFYFGGFFPRKDKARADALDAVRTLDAALIFYESPNRVASALQAIAAAFPQRVVTVCRELTKLHEEVVRGLAPEVAADFAGRESVKGEIVLVIDPPAAEEAALAADEDAIRARAAELSADGLRSKDVAKQLVAEFGISRNDAYDYALG